MLLQYINQIIKHVECTVTGKGLTQSEEPLQKCRRPTKLTKNKCIAHSRVLISFLCLWIFGTCFIQYVYWISRSLIWEIKRLSLNVYFSIWDVSFANKIIDPHQWSWYYVCYRNWYHFIVWIFEEIPSKLKMYIVSS